MLQALYKCVAAASPDSTASAPDCPERSQAPGLLARTDCPILGIFIARILLSVEIGADSRRAVEALPVLYLQFLLALQRALERIDLSLCMRETLLKSFDLIARMIGSLERTRRGYIRRRVILSVGREHG